MITNVSIHMAFESHILVLATNNTHKVSEIRKIAPEGFVFASLNDINFTDDLPETTGTIMGNAMQKARTVWESHQMNCLADDSGLCIEALNGEPGVDSAFYAGLPPDHTANVNKVLLEMKGTENRKAYFITVLALILDGKEYLFEGRVNGKIAHSPAGASGFGYDPIFIADGFNKTFAEMSPDEKNSISHRSVALKKLFSFLQTQ